MPKLPKAAALAYDAQKESAPKLLAKGQGHIAQAIIDKAIEHDIVRFENPQLVDALLRMELDTQIAPALYESVATLFAWLYKVEQSAS
ncbi:MAG: hypothetical protein KU28_01165 [Sulfurovum sp. PC08-66]|nr:MAG: hypothetical protein KU28_01165 [Sulfurovum sp. PC08-66]KIM12566.1 MAG: hypothetical protein KU37_01280 [Sulfuricurvum sp. PC08-66]